MKFLDRLERRFRHLAVPNIIMTLVIVQLLVYTMILAGLISYNTLPLIPKAVLSGGEYWRIFSFIIAPPYIADTALKALFLAFFWYILWMMSSALESNWGVFRFNVYLLLGIVLSIICAFVGQLISPSAFIVIFPDFLYLSIFLAFAVIYPNFEFYMFFILPVKVKWLAWLAGVMTTISVLFSPSWGERIAILGPLFNFFLFFHRDLYNSIKSRKRRAKFEADKRTWESEVLHTCSECGATDQSNPQLSFRYKTIDDDAVCICDVCRYKNEQNVSTV